MQRKFINLIFYTFDIKNKEYVTWIVPRKLFYVSRATTLINLPNGENKAVPEKTRLTTRPVLQKIVNVISYY